MVANSYYFSVVMFVFFPSLGFIGVRLSVACVLGGVYLASLGWRFPSSTLCRAVFVDFVFLKSVFF